MKRGLNMTRRSLNKLLLILCIFSISNAAWGQIQPQEVSKQMSANLQKLREYSWSTQTEVRLKGQQISVTLDKFRYDIDGRLQIIPLGGSGKLSPEMQPVISELVEMGVAYSQPKPQDFSAFFSRAEKWHGSGGTLRIEGEDFLRSGDRVDLRAKNNRADRLSVETIYGDNIPATIDAEFRSLPNEGPNYVARLEISIPEDGIDIIVENFDYVYNAPVAASDVSIIPPSTELKARLTAPMSSKQAKQGQEFQAVLDSDLVVNGATALKKGTPVIGEVVEVDDADRAQGKGKMSIRLKGITVNGKVLAIETNTLKFEAEGTGKKTRRRLLGGAGIGAAVGAIADGGSGAWKGAAIGAGIGGAAVLLTKGKDVEFPAEQLFSFTLSKELKIVG
jgi:hypothetical protein